MKGRIIGVIIGFFLFNVIGAIIGYLIGNELDKENSQKQQNKTEESLKSKSKVDDRRQTNNKQENHELKKKVKVKVAKEVEHSIEGTTQKKKSVLSNLTKSINTSSDATTDDIVKLGKQLKDLNNDAKREDDRLARNKGTVDKLNPKGGIRVNELARNDEEVKAKTDSLSSNDIEHIYHSVTVNPSISKNPCLLNKIERGNNLDDIVRNVCNSGLLKYSELKPDWASYSKILRQNNINVLYHFTSSKNIPQIKQSGGLLSWYASETRNNDVSIYGGDSLSRNLDRRFGNHDYVHLSFCDDHPMSYRLKQAGEHVVWLEISPVVILLKDTIFSDINAADNNHHQGGSISDLKRINFDATKMHYLQRNDVNFKPHQAEVMVKTFLPKKYILNLESI